MLLGHIDKRNLFKFDIDFTPMKENIKPEKTRLEKVLIKSCENLPLNITLFEENGKCKKPNSICKYCVEKQLYIEEPVYFCHKKTYTYKKNLLPI